MKKQMIKATKVFLAIAMVVVLSIPAFASFSQENALPRASNGTDTRKVMINGIEYLCTFRFYPEGDGGSVRSEFITEAFVSRNHKSISATFSTVNEGYKVASNNEPYVTDKMTGSSVSLPLSYSGNVNGVYRASSTGAIVDDGNGNLFAIAVG